jgi:hypothetical protein
MHQLKPYNLSCCNSSSLLTMTCVAFSIVPFTSNTESTCQWGISTKTMFLDAYCQHLFRNSSVSLSERTELIPLQACHLIIQSTLFLQRNSLNKDKSNTLDVHISLKREIPLHLTISPGSRQLPDRNLRYSNSMNPHQQWSCHHPTEIVM